MGILETVFQSATVLVALAGAYVVAFWFVLIVWAYRDIESRSRSVVTQVFSTLMVVLFFVPGVLLYLILRPKETLDQAFQRSLEEEYLLQDLEELPLCPTCHRYVEDDFVLCPQCHAQLRDACSGCTRLVDLRWALCPYCATVQGGQAETVERVAVPAARWTAPDRRRRRVVAVPADRPSPSDDAALPATAAASAIDGEAGGAISARGPVVAQEERPLPFTLVSGMRSIVRTAERARGHHAEPHGGRDGNGSANGDGAHRIFRPFQSGSVESDVAATLPNGSNGNGGTPHRPGESVGASDDDLVAAARSKTPDSSSKA